MIESAIAQLRLALSVGFGRPFSARSLERVVAGLKASRREFGDIINKTEVMGPAMDADTISEVHARRMRHVARLAGRETPYYAEQFAALGLDPDNLSAADLARLPVTPKEAVRDRPDDFIRRGARVYLRPTTTGTTGKPTSIAFSLHEMRVYAALQAIDSLTNGTLREDDIVQIATASRGLLGNVNLAGACAHVGALVTMTGIVDPAYALAHLAEAHRIPGKRPKVTVLQTYPSYLGELVESGLRLGHKPDDFGLRSIGIGGEIVTSGVVDRARSLFGQVEIGDGGYGMTEIWPLGGTRCEAGHLHFQPAYGKVEVLALDGDEPAAPGEPGRIIATPFFPFRETTMLLRYDTGDVARVLPELPSCSMRHLPATSNLLGKLKYAARLGHGWVFPRDVLEAVGSVADVPLPGRVRWEATPDGLAVWVVVRPECDRAAARRAISEALAARGVAVATLELCNGPTLPGAFPWRADQREMTL